MLVAQPVVYGSNALGGGYGVYGQGPSQIVLP